MLKLIAAITAVILFYAALAPAIENVRLREDLRIERSIVAVMILAEIKKAAPIPAEPPKFIPRPVVRIRKKRR